MIREHGMQRFDKVNGVGTLDLYQAMFEGADLFMSFWQPTLKGVGRAQLEMAQLAAKCGQSTVQWAVSLATCRTPSDVMAANLKYFDDVAAYQRDSVEKLTAAIAKVAEPPRAFEVLKMPQRPHHDMIVLPDIHDEADVPRRVA